MRSMNLTHWIFIDTIGFSSTGWYREHLLQHHMYTNTPLDNHFHGTDPFLITDPTMERNWFQKWITPVLNPVILTFGLWGNYLFHLGEVSRIESHECDELAMLTLFFIRQR